MISFNDYQQRAISTAIYPVLLTEGEGWENVGQESLGFVYPTLGLCGEAGEVAEKVKKIVRDSEGRVTEESRAAIAKELGDVLWYVAALCKEFGLNMGDVAQANLDKLAARKERGTLGGSGDNR